MRCHAWMISFSNALHDASALAAALTHGCPGQNPFIFRHSLTVSMRIGIVELLWGGLKHPTTEKTDENVG
jgi:hypothetical protein